MGAEGSEGEQLLAAELAIQCSAVLLQGGIQLLAQLGVVLQQGLEGMQRSGRPWLGATGVSGFRRGLLLQGRQLPEADGIGAGVEGIHGATSGWSGMAVNNAMEGHCRLDLGGV